MKILLDDIVEFYNIDAIKGMKKLPRDSIDLVFADLPYGNTLSAGDNCIPFDEMWKAIKHCTRRDSVICLFGEGKFLIELCSSNLKNFRYLYTWDKSLKSGFMHAKARPLKQTEQIAVFYRKRGIYNPQFTEGTPSHDRTRATSVLKTENPYYGTFKNAPLNKNRDLSQKYPTDLLRFPKPHPTQCLHPYQKPIDLCRYIIRTYTNPGDRVLDFCCGSGSIPIAAFLEGRKAIGFDIGVNRDGVPWVNIACSRLKEYRNPNEMNLNFKVFCK